MPGQWFSIRRVRTWVLLVFVSAIIHIATTLWLARPHDGQPFRKVFDELAKAQFTVLPEVTPATQRLPFLMPEAHYAICPFELTDRSLAINATLFDVGWVLSLHGLDGQSFYYAPGSDDGPLQVRLHVVPPGEELNGVETSMTGRARQIPQVISPAPKGLAVLRAPINARAYAGRAVRDLQKSACRRIGLPQRGRQVQTRSVNQSRS